MDIEVEQTIY